MTPIFLNGVLSSDKKPNLRSNGSSAGLKRGDTLVDDESNDSHEGFTTFERVKMTNEF